MHGSINIAMSSQNISSSYGMFSFTDAKYWTLINNEVANDTASKFCFMTVHTWWKDEGIVCCGCVFASIPGDITESLVILSLERVGAAGRLIGSSVWESCFYRDQFFPSWSPTTNETHGTDKTLGVICYCWTIYVDYMWGHEKDQHRGGRSPNEWAQTGRISTVSHFSLQNEDICVGSLTASAPQEEYWI